MFNAFSAAVKNFGDCEVYADKIVRWDTKRLMTILFDEAKPMSCGFQVLNHGDIWINNMMFKSDQEGNLLDVSMIDFQGLFWASPVHDVLYFLISSVADDIKVEYFDDFIEFYHIQLTAALKKLKFDQYIPSLHDLHVDLLEKSSLCEFLI